MWDSNSNSMRLTINKLFGGKFPIIKVAQVYVTLEGTLQGCI